ncbi:hypothetical protein HELRODRAFT_69008, partial [Helobdella robusta]|uniref:Small ribosomal subunit protein uS7 domain-containing protein n=1 Tax=Helobdella robusta TaxID=6412 RepID=T1FZN3_HELRO
SRYGPIYLEPTFRKENLPEFLEETDDRKYRPIKAAQNEQTSFATYNDLVLKFIRILLREGNKERARNLVHKTFENVKLTQIERFNKAQTDFEKESIELNPVNIFNKAINNCKPLLNIKKIKRGGVMYQVPVPISPNSQVFFAMKWLIESANEKDRISRVWDKLAQELLDASNNEGKSVRKKQELHRLCEANRAYAHFRW